MNRLLDTLHNFAIKRGWYKDVTYGLPLNVCRTVFGTHFLEAEFTRSSLKSLLELMFQWGWDQSKEVTERVHLEQRMKAMEPYYTEWKVRKDGKARYRKVAMNETVKMWRTESEPLFTTVDRLSRGLTVLEIVANQHGQVMAETSANEVW